jgi:sulfonate transport system substrate-binding protein
MTLPSIKNPPVIGRRASLAALGGLAASFAVRDAAFAAETPPAQIRLGGVGYGYGKQFGQHVIAVLQAGSYIENELKAPGTRVVFQFFDRTGPAINEALAAGQLDFASYGELPQIIGRAGGLPTRVVANGGVSAIYVAVRNGVRAQKIADLKGLRVTLQRGTILHQALDRMLEQNGLSEADVQLYDLPTADQLTALTNGDVDASVGVASLLSLRDRGIVRVIYTTAGKVTPDGINAFSVTEDFSQRYPATTHAVVRAFVKAAFWTAQPKNREAVLDIWAKSGTPRPVLAEDISGNPLKLVDIPLIDSVFVDGLKAGVAFSLQNKLIRRPVDVDTWIDRSFVEAALHDLSLAAFWTPRRTIASSQ